MTSITWAGPRCVQELGAFLGSQNRTQRGCDQQSAVMKVNYNITDCSEEVVVGGVDPLRGPARGPGEHVARVAVVVARVPPPPHAPHVLPQQVLVRALPRGRRRVRSPVRQHRRPAVRPPFSPERRRTFKM